MKGRIIQSLILLAMLVAGCGTEYYDVDTEVLNTPEGVTDVIPQEGTTLSVALTYRFDYYTRFEPGYDYKQYRYRVLIDGWTYGYGVVTSEYEIATIPIMANDTHLPAKIVVEGARALEYKDNPEEWDTWHQLYSGIQECLPASEKPKFDALKGARLKVTIDGGSFLFDIKDSGAGEAFKRLIAGREITVPVYVDDSIWIGDDPESFRTEAAESIPPDYGRANDRHKAGEIHLEKNGWLSICLKDREITGYDTLLGTVRSEDLKPLKSLYPGRHRQEQMTMTLSLEY